MRLLYRNWIKKVIVEIKVLEGFVFGFAVEDGINAKLAVKVSSLPFK